MSQRHIVTTPSLFKVDDSFDDPRFMKVRIKALHSDSNLNKSNFTESSLKKSKDLWTYSAVLANTITAIDEDGNEYLDYGGHDMHKETDAFNEGERRIIFDEKVVGIIPADNNFEIIYDEEEKKQFIWIDAILYRDYGNYVVDILEAKGGQTDVSAEVEFLDTSYDSKKKEIIVNEFRPLGITLLGNDCTPAMKTAKAEMFTIADDTKEEQLVNVMKELTEALNKYTATFAENSKRKEEKDKLNTELFNELLKQYSVSESDITFDYSELDDDALKAAFAEQFDDGDASSSESGDGDSSESEATEGSDAEDSGASNDDGDDESQAADAEPVSILGASDTVEGNDEEEDQDELEANNSYPSGSKLYQVEYALTNGETVQSYAISMNEEIAAITELVNATYCEEDNDWYNCEVYGSEHTVIMHGWYKHFKQKYTVKNGVYTLKGERTEVFAQYLTQEEIEALEGLKGKFSEVSDKLALYESEPEKIAILSSEDYSLIKDTDEYKELSKRDNYFSLSTEEITSKLDNMLNTYAKELGKKNFSVEEAKEEKTEEVKKDFFAFARVETKSSFLDGLLGKN